MGARFGFPRERRVRKRREFVAIQSGGRKVHSRHFLVVVSSGRGRLGITVSKKVGNAVVRNHIKRCVREFARHSDWHRHPIDVVVIAKRSAAARPCPALASDLDSVTNAVCR